MPASHACKHVPNMLPSGKLFLLVLCLFCTQLDYQRVCIAGLVELCLGEKWAAMSVIQAKIIDPLNIDPKTPQYLQCVPVVTGQELNTRLDTGEHVIHNDTNFVTQLRLWSTGL